MNNLIEEYVWDQIFIILKEERSVYVKQERALRLFIEAIHYVARSGCQWRLLPHCYGKWSSVHKRFKRWEKNGIWDKILHRVQKEPDKESFMIDATTIRAHSCAAGYEKNGNEKHSLGRSKGGFTTKVHALCDGLGSPLKFILTPGQAHDITQAEKLIENIDSGNVLADKGYDSDDFLRFVEKQGCVPVIPPRKNRIEQRSYDKNLYKERHLIECFFGKIKHFRRVFSRFDKSSSSFMAFLNFVSIFIWLR